MPKSLLYSVSAFITKRELIWHKVHRKYLYTFGAIAALAFVAGSVFFFPQRPAVADNFTYVTVYYDGTQQTFATHAKTVGELLSRANIPVSQADMVEPAENTALVSQDENVNIYSARPVEVVDGMNRYNVLTAAQTPQEIVAAAGLTLYPQDQVSMTRINNFVEDGGAGLMVTIKRATPLTFVMYGNTLSMRTQATTVGGFLQEQGITLKPGDQLDQPMDAPITSGMTINLVHNGSEIVTHPQVIAYTTQTVQDANEPVGYQQITQQGVNGEALVTYQLNMQNGQEVSEQQLNSVTETPATPEIIDVGTQESDNRATWLYKLRMCESHGNYTEDTGNGFYGAYQFSEGTWDTLDTGYAYAYEAPPAVQDQAIITNTLRSSAGLASQNPGCYASTGISAFPPDD
jgi:uncharacterized protein YabE (DUF348 family)